MKRPRGGANGARRSIDEVDADACQEDDKQITPDELRIQEHNIEEQKQQDDEVDECIAIMETTITEDGPEKDDRGTFVSWPVKLISNTCCWLTLELGRLLDDNKIARAASSDEPGHFLPSVVVFLLVLLFVNSYGDTLDRVTRNCVGSAFRTLRGGMQLLSVLTWEDIEGLATAAVVVLFWIGAFRIVVNIVSRLVDAPKFIAP
ncbi:hypothetical protein QAD02_006209 [Eretmocerus hayati]|uniref:Uncharacterized protein n=1 Tax=Eretmocerus hayati TaxID=131215 RepID=A0ACC2N0F3_9HYME|nr:hypothetical protein QAD02_006209 [Eretmocerus hayati]